AQQGVAKRVDDDVAIGMRHHTALVRHAHASQHHMVAFAEGMDVESLAYAHVPVPFVRDSRNSANARSAAVVILMLSSAPSTSSGRMPVRSMAMASSVTARPAERAACSASVSAPRRNICGVKARQRD